GSNKALWLCPEDARSKAETYAEGSDFAGSYIPTEFDEVPNTAFRWSRQPWLMERGELHGEGNGGNMLMPDGSIRQTPSMMSR
ncbi:MAG: hypothetical protein ACOYMN_22680, partial [Roseimicrobium sp.]